MREVLDYGDFFLKKRKKKKKKKKLKEGKFEMIAAFISSEFLCGEDSFKLH